MNSRREFLKRSGAAVTGATLSLLSAHAAAAVRSSPRDSHYGDLKAMPDQDGRVVLALPEGFRYVTFSRTGEVYGPGLIVPRSLDGMAAFRGPGGTVRLIRNHELANRAGDHTLGVNVPPELRYDAKASGGCMTLDFDPAARRLVRQFASLGGTLVNCAGGASYGDAGWFTCEEYTSGPPAGYDKPHGYVFHVPATAEATVAAVPLKALGRFRHEAAVADDRGLVYETEDAANTSGFYRYTPAAPDNLNAGRLQMLGIRDDPRATLYAGQSVGRRLPVQWIDVDRPDPDLEAGAPSCFAQARARGGAAFNRLEGIFRGEDGRSIYFTSTSGGDARGPGNVGYGQVWRYVPADATRLPDRASAGRIPQDELVLVFESRGGSVLESPDNLCITPRGGILLCEDDAVSDRDGHPLAGAIAEVNRVVALGSGGEAFTFAVNVLNYTELAGVCFSPDGEILFVNIYGTDAPGSGMTCAIWGPWERGPL